MPALPYIIVSLAVHCSVARVVSLLDDGIVLEQHIISHNNKRVVGQGKSTIVSYDYRSHSKASRLPAFLPLGIQALETKRDFAAHDHHDR